MRAELDIAKRRYVLRWQDGRLEERSDYALGPYDRKVVAVAIESFQEEIITSDSWRKIPEKEEMEKGEARAITPAYVCLDVDGKSFNITPAAAMVLAAMLEASAKAALR